MGTITACKPWLAPLGIVATPLQGVVRPVILQPGKLIEPVHVRLATPAKSALAGTSFTRPWMEAVLGDCCAVYKLSSSAVNFSSAASAAYSVWFARRSLPLTLPSFIVRYAMEAATAESSRI